RWAAPGAVPADASGGPVQPPAPGAPRAAGGRGEAEGAGGGGVPAPAGAAVLRGPQGPLSVRPPLGLKEGPLTTRYLLRRDRPSVPWWLRLNGHDAKADVVVTPLGLEPQSAG